MALGCQCDCKGQLSRLPTVLGVLLSLLISKHLYILPPERSKCSLGFLWVLRQVGCLLINEATRQMGGYGFGQVLTKHIYISEHTAKCHSLWCSVMVACASEQTHSSCTPGFPSPKRYNLPRHVQCLGAGDRAIKSVGFSVSQILIRSWARSDPIWLTSGGVVYMWV